MAKKFLSALLAVLMVISIVPMTAMADSIAETTPTLVVGVSANAATATTDVNKVLSREVTLSADPDAPILWFAMTGLGTDSNKNKYKLSMIKGTDETKEVLGTRYVNLASDGRVFTPTNSKYCMYVGLDDCYAAEGGTGKQLNSDLLKPSTFKSDSFTVRLINDNTNKVLATKTITLVKDGSTWTCTTSEANDLSTIEFRKHEKESNIFPSTNEGTDGKALGDIQTGDPKFTVTADGTNKWKVSVSGPTLKYVSGWTGFNGSNTVEQHGYYFAMSVPKVLCGNVIKSWTAHGTTTEGGPLVDKTMHTTDAAFSEYNGSYCDIVTYLGENSEVAQKKTTTWKITYGSLPEQTYTIDFSGLKFPSESIEAKPAEDTVYTKKPNELQSEIVATTDEANKTVRVTGTSYYVKEWTGYSSNNDINSGNFVALKLTNKAGVPMRIFSPKKGSTGTWIQLDDGVIVGRMQNLKADGYKLKVKVGSNDPTKDGTDWTIDFSGVEMREASTRLEVDPIYTKLDGALNDKKGSDLQEDITSTTKTDSTTGVTTITFKGESKYVAGWTNFDATLKEGNYIALKFTLPEGYDKPSNINWDADAPAGQYTVILDGSNDYKISFNLTGTGKTTQKYVLDFTGIKRLPATIDSVVTSPSPVTAEGMTNLKASYDSTNNKIVLSGLVEGLKNNKNLFSNVNLTVKYATKGEKTIEVRFTKVGDALEAAAIPATVAGNTLSFDTSKLLIKSENATDKVDTKPAEAAVSTSIPEAQKTAAEEVAKTLTDNSGKVSVDKDTLQKYANVISNESEAKKELVSDAATIVSANADKVPTKLKNRIDEGDVTTVVLAYAKIEVVGAETNDKNEITNFQLDITPMARTIVTTVTNTNNIKLFDSTKDATANVNANAIEVKNEEIAIGESTEVKLALPASYKADKAFITHTKDDGAEYHYTGKIEGSNPRTLTFTSTHGFSSFTISSTESAASKDATLKTLKVGSTDAVVTGTATPYTAVATLPKGSDLTKQTLTLAATNANAKITVNGNAYTTGMTVDLSASKTVNIAVTAEDGTTKATYALTAKLSTGEPSDEYHDIPSGGMGDWVKSAINYGLMSNIGKNADGKLTFGPIESVLRKEFAVMVARADVIAKNADIKDKDAADKYLKDNYISEKLSFSDIAGQADTYIAAIEYCKKNDIIAGYENGTFRPNAKVSRTEAASMVVGWLKLDDTNKTNPSSFKDWSKVGWAQGKVNAVVAAGIMKGESDTEFGTGELTRQQIAVIIVRSYRKVAGITVTE